MSYKKYTDDDLIESYTTMIDYSGKANPEILNEIENRGGIEGFLRKIENKKFNQKEINRIINEVNELSNDYKDLEFVKQFIKSDILNKQDLEELIERKFKEHQMMIADRNINSKTLFGSFLGILIGSFLGFIFLILSVLLLKKIIFFLIIGVYIICYFSIKLITKQSRNNAVVFIASVIATIISIVLTVLTAKLL